MDFKDKFRDSLFAEHAFDADLKIYSEEGEEIEHLFSLYLTKSAYLALINISRIVFSESLRDNYVENISDEFENIIGVLFRHFKKNHIDEHGNLEDSLVNYIEHLKDYKFFLPRDLVKSKVRGLTPLDFDLGYEADLDLLVECIKNILVFIREERIAFWETLYKKYKENKEGIDLEFRTKCGRLEKDLNKASRITPEDLKDTFK